MHGLNALSSLLAAQGHWTLSRRDDTVTPEACTPEIETLCPVARAPGFLWSVSCVDNFWSCSYLPAREEPGMGRSRPVRIMTETTCSPDTDVRCAASSRFVEEEAAAEEEDTTPAKEPETEAERLALEFDKFWADAEKTGEELDAALNLFWRNAEIDGQVIADELEAAEGNESEMDRLSLKSDEFWNGIDVLGDQKAAELEDYWKRIEEEGRILEEELEAAFAAEEAKDDEAATPRLARRAARSWNWTR